MSDWRKARAMARDEGIGAVLRAARRRAVLVAFELLKRPFERPATPELPQAIFDRFVAQVNSLDRPRVLEVGSRARSGVVRRDLFAKADYVGFDIARGPNVDVVGDAHELSSHFPADHFDAVFALSVFEHLAMPWKAVLELNRILKPGGLLCVMTHPTYPPHDLPWDFWRYSPEAFRVLFSKPHGFELLECGEGVRCSIVPLSHEPPLIGLWREPAFLSVTATARKTAAPDARLRWDVPLGEVLSTSYPA